MTIKGFLNICAGIIGAGTLTFEDAETTQKTLFELAADNHSGYRKIPSGKKVIVSENKEMIAGQNTITIRGNLIVRGNLIFRGAA